MKTFTTAAVAASILSSRSLVHAAAFRVVESPFDLIETLGGNTFKALQVPNPSYQNIQSGPLAIAKAFTKYNANFPDGLQSLIDQLLGELGLLKNGSSSSTGANTTTNANQGEVAATPLLFDSEYVSEVLIGTPPQTLNLDFDTGSSDLWVFSSETPKSEVNGQSTYNITQSSTAKRLTGQTWSITYGDGSSSAGNVYADTVTIGGVTVQNQAVESATNVSAQFSQNPTSDGLLGLAFDNLNTVRPTAQKTFFANAMDNLAMPLFTANLKKGEAGNYNFGFLDTSEYTGSITFVPVNSSSGFWQFEAAGFGVGNSATVQAPHVAIADTGTTLLLLPDAIVEEYYSQIQGAVNSKTQGGFTVPCNADMPDFTAVIGSYKGVVPGSFIIYAPIDGTTIQNSQTCFGGIQSSAGLGFSIYGDIFLKSQFVVFNGGSEELGFAAKPLTT